MVGSPVGISLAAIVAPATISSPPADNRRRVREISATRAEELLLKQLRDLRADRDCSFGPHERSQGQGNRTLSQTVYTSDRGPQRVQRRCPWPRATIASPYIRQLHYGLPLCCMHGRSREKDWAHLTAADWRRQICDGFRQPHIRPAQRPCLMGVGTVSLLCASHVSIVSSRHIRCRCNGSFRRLRRSGKIAFGGDGKAEAYQARHPFRSASSGVPQ